MRYDDDYDKHVPEHNNLEYLLKSTTFNKFSLDKGIHEANSDNTSKIMTKITKGSKCFLGMKVKYLLSDVPTEGTISELVLVQSLLRESASCIMN